MNEKHQACVNVPVGCAVAAVLPWCEAPLPGAIADGPPVHA
jgi:hypothetical protein